MIDAATLEASNALAAAGIDAVLLKGAAIAQRLYDDWAERSYGDVDLLVAPDGYTAAEDVLRRLGFSNPLDGAAHHEEQLHATVWRRGPVEIDLHHRLYYYRGDAAQLWRAFRADAQPIFLGRTGAMLAVGDISMALVVAAHSVQHHGVGKHAEDLRRAIDRFPFQTWTAAAELARRLDMAEVMGAGLRQTDEGHQLADDLGLPDAVSAEIKLVSEGNAQVALTLLRMLEAGSPAEQLRLMLAELVPSRAFMHKHWPSRRPGTRGLIFAYFDRLLRLGVKLPRAVREVRAARRAHR